MRSQNRLEGIWFLPSKQFKPEPGSRQLRLHLELSDHRGRAMENDPNRFRQYAAECQRLAEQASGKDQGVLLEIANAWLSCAEQAERKKRAGVKKD